MNYMKLYTNNTFSGRWPVPVAAVVIAKDQTIAAQILNDELKKRGLDGDAEPEDMQPFDDLKQQVRILSDGDY